MSFELFVQAYKNHEPYYYPSRIAEEIFNRDAIRPSIPLSYVEYDDGRAEIYGAEEVMTNGIMLTHFGGRTVLGRVLELAAKTGSVIFWPEVDDLPWVVPDLAVVNHLPDELSKEQFIAVSDVDKLIEAIGLV